MVTINLWLHIIAFVVWLGGIGFILGVLGPTANGLPAELSAKILDQGRRSFETLSWTAIGLLFVTGSIAIIMRSQPFSQAGSFYLTVLALKLFLFLAMVFHHALQVFKYGPRIAAATYHTTSETSGWPEPLKICWSKWFVLLKINAALGLITVLLGLALARN